MDDVATRDTAQEFLALLEVVRELRQRCPWDREQTLAASAHHLVEEAYEAADAIEHGGDREIDDELGDLLVQVLFAANIVEEQRGLEVAGMLRRARDKLVRRHPHVYAGVAAASSAEVVQNWDKLKQQERAAAGATSAVDGIARALPALTRAQKLGERARSAGMDWPEASAVLDKVSEEIAEARAALAHGDRDHAAEEMGDAMLALANAPRFVGHDAETTLSRACEKFIERFKQVERAATERKLELAALDPRQIENLWQEAKRRLGDDERR
ncbi:MAG TPA: nucleoside triphosphate pyrophosphohydrolase [Candidatus Binataceae bacterium]|nr:nucleoside triphosphate pyrophosphohydrolase [Candidatus Binataceae bacterium]